MSFYEPQGWQAPARQASWEQPPPPSRSGASSTSQREDGAAFATQFEEVDRAIDNLVKSGKFYTPGPRRDSMASMMGSGRQFHDHGHRMQGSRHSVSDVDPSRSFPAANVQNFYASQRYQGRHGEPDQMVQAKRRMAQQRERDLRNYHQEQQYNRSVLAEMASNKSDRSMSPSTISEDGRRELIARQHRALYGSEGAAFVPQSGFGDEQQPGSAKSLGGPRGPSPRGMDPFPMPSQSQQPVDASSQGAGQPDNAASPAAPSTTGFNKASTPPSTDDSSHSRQLSKSTTAPLAGSMAPIGSRPSGQQAAGQNLNKRTTSPLPSALSYGFGSAEQSNERSGSSNSNNAQKENQPNPNMGAWGTGSGVWGSNKIGATSVWG